MRLTEKMAFALAMLAHSLATMAAGSPGAASPPSQGGCDPRAEGVAVSAESRRQALDQEAMEQLAGWVAETLDLKTGAETEEGSAAAWDLVARASTAIRHDEQPDSEAPVRARLFVLLALEERAGSGAAVRSRPIRTDGRGATRDEAVARAMDSLMNTRAVDVRRAEERLLSDACRMRELQLYTLEIRHENLDPVQQAMVEELLPVVLAPWAERNALPVPEQPSRSDEHSPDEPALRLPGGMLHAAEVHGELQRELIELYGLDGELVVEQREAGTVVIRTKSPGSSQ